MGMASGRANTSNDGRRAKPWCVREGRRQRRRGRHGRGVREGRERRRGFPHPTLQGNKRRGSRWLLGGETRVRSGDVAPAAGSRAASASRRGGGHRGGDEEAGGEAAFQAAWGGVMMDEGEMEATGDGVGRGSVEGKARGRGGGARRRWVARTRRQGPSAVGRFVPPIPIWIGEGGRGVRSWGGGVERAGGEWGACGLGFGG